MGIRLTRVTDGGGRTIWAGKPRPGGRAKEGLRQVLAPDDAVLDILDDDLFFDTSVKEGRIDQPSERPEGDGEILTLKRRRGTSVLESVCIWYGKAFATYWVRRIKGPWPSLDDLVDLVDGGLLNFGGTVDFRSDDVALVRVNVD